MEHNGYENVKLGVRVSIGEETCGREEEREEGRESDAECSKCKEKGDPKKFMCLVYEDLRASQEEFLKIRPEPKGLNESGPIENSSTTSRRNC